MLTIVLPGFNVVAETALTPLSAAPARRWRIRLISRTVSANDRLHTFSWRTYEHRATAAQVFGVQRCAAICRVWRRYSWTPRKRAPPLAQITQYARQLLPAPLPLSIRGPANSLQRCINAGYRTTNRDHNIGFQARVAAYFSGVLPFARAWRCPARDAALCRIARLKTPDDKCAWRPAASLAEYPPAHTSKFGGNIRLRQMMAPVLMRDPVHSRYFPNAYRPCYHYTPHRPLLYFPLYHVLPHITYQRQRRPL